MTKQKKHHSIVGFSKERDSADFYPTPPKATWALLKREKFEGNIWECASGDGRMSKVLEEVCDNVISSDIRIDDEVYGEKGVNFLKTKRQVDNIITNPPYRYAREFVEHSLKCANKKVAMLLKLVFCEGISRYRLFKDNPPRTIYVFCRRVPIYKRGKKMRNKGLIAYAWFVWEKGFKGKPEMEWIPDDFA